MNRTEERLRAATRAAARTVPDGSAPPLRLPAGPAARPARRYRPPRSGWRRAMAPLAAAAAVTAVVGVAVAVTHLHGLAGRDHHRPGGGASQRAAVRGVPRGPALCAQHGRRAVVGDRAGHRHDRAAAPVPDVRHGVRDRGRRPAVRPDGPAVPQGDRSRRAGEPALRQPHPGRVLHPDGQPRRHIGPAGGPARRALRAGGARGARAGCLRGRRVAGRPQARARHARRPRGPRIRVATLASGASRTWRWAAPGWVGEDKPEWQPLSWRGDSRTLAFQAHTGLSGGGPLEIGLLDTATVPGVRWPRPGSCCGSPGYTIAWSS